MTSSLFRTFGEYCAALPKMGENLVGAYPAAPGGLWVADVSRRAASPARGRRGESAVPSMRGAPWGKAGWAVPEAACRRAPTSVPCCPRGDGRAVVVVLGACPPGLSTAGRR